MRFKPGTDGKENFDLTFFWVIAFFLFSVIVILTYLGNL